MRKKEITGHRSELSVLKIERQTDRKQTDTKKIQSDKHMLNRRTDSKKR